VTKFHAAWLVASFLISLGANELLAPRFDYAAAAGSGTLASGELIASGIARGTLKLVDLRVVAADVEMAVGSPLPVRVLVLRGALGEEQTETDLEMFVDLSPEEGRPIAVDARSMDAIKGRALKVLPRAIASDLRSRVRLPGADGPAYVKGGSLTLNEALQTEPGAWRVRGELDIEVETASEVISLFARLSGKVVWP